MHNSNKRKSMRTLIKTLFYALLGVFLSSCNPYKEIIVDASEGGSIYYHPDGSFESLQLEGTSITIEAKPYYWNGYEFSGWYVTGTDQLVSTSIIYTFVVVDDTYLEARFVKSPIISINCSEGGKVFFENSDEMTIYAESGSNVTVVAVPNNDHYFIGWFIDGSEVSISTKERFTFTVTEDVKLTAVFRPVQAESIAFTLEEYVILVGQERKLDYEILPHNTASKELIWYVEDTDIASVDSGGVVTAKNIGETIVRVSLKGTSLSDECRVIVCPIEVSFVSIKEHDADLLLGTQMELFAYVHPENATDQRIEWSSSDETIATVDERGIVHAVGLGEVSITATSVDGGHTATTQLAIHEIDYFVEGGFSLSTTHHSGYITYTLTLRVETTNGVYIDISSVELIGNNGSYTASAYDIGYCNYWRGSVDLDYYNSNTYGWYFDVNFSYEGKSYTKRFYNY